jgi:acetyl-CoA C-acetyltransferase/3-oxo-5,6-didehydrosuberyl-CoA/3-oxoadipyl-CoA thiolase
MNTPVITEAVRTPIGRYGGALASVRPDDLAATVIRALIDRTGIDPALIEDVYFGAANQAGEDNRNVARMAALLAGLPDTVAGCTVNRLCASGLEAINLAAALIRAGQGEVFIAGGVESMSRAPYVMLKAQYPYERGLRDFVDSTIGWRFTNKALAKLHYPFSMGETAENVAKKLKITREDQDRFAFESQIRTKNAMDHGRFDDEIIPVEIQQRKGDPIIVTRDEHPRPDTTVETLGQLRPAFAEDGTVTAGNSSGINDGAAAVLIMSEETAKRIGQRPLATLVSSATAGVDPACMGLGPVPALRKVSERSGVRLQDIDVFELNEAFAAQSLGCIRQLGIENATINPNGGAIALGHPLGCSGARITTTLLHEMQRTNQRYGIATMCVGVGQGVATLFQR